MHDVRSFTAQVSLAAAVGLACPHIAHQEFVEEEDPAFRKLLDDYRKTSGNSSLPFALESWSRPLQAAP